MKISLILILSIYRNTAFIISILQKDCHQDDLSFVFLQFCKHNCLKILAGNIFFVYK